MSYKQAVLRDNPTAFWPLNGVSTERTYATILLEYLTYQDWLNAESSYGAASATFTLEDISSNGNHGAFTIGSPNFIDILPLVTLSSYDTSRAGCKINSVSEIGISNISQLYNMFYNGTEHLSFGIEFWISFDKNPATDNQVFFVEYGANKIVKINVKNDEIAFTINGKDKFTGADLEYTTYKQVQSWESQSHIYAYYDKGTIGINVNSFGGTPVTVPTNFQFDNDPGYGKQIFYKIGPSGSLNSFVINDLAFYDYNLSVDQIRSHMVWGTNDSKPKLQSQSTSSYFFDIQDFENMFAYKKMFSNPLKYQEGAAINLISDNTGLTLQRTSTAASGTGTWTYSVPTSGLTNLSGMKVGWDSATSDDTVNSPDRYVKIEISLDNGTTWSQVQNELPIFKFDSNASAYGLLLVRATIHTSDTSQSLLPRLDNMFIGVYNDLSIYSDSGAFLLAPRTTDTYTIKTNKFNILSRSKNFGINLAETDGNNSIAAIYPQPQSPSYQSLEFWFRYDSISQTQTQFILDTVGGNGYVYFSAEDGGVVQNGFSSVYINGIELSAIRSLTLGETYHFVCVYPQVMKNTIYLGGSSDLTQYSQGTYGYLTIYTYPLTQIDAQNRYLAYLTSNVGVLNQNDSSIGTIAEYAGSSTDYNGGSPILAYTSPTFTNY